MESNIYDFCSGMVCLFKGYVSQILVGQFMNTLFQIKYIKTFSRLRKKPPNLNLQITSNLFEGNNPDIGVVLV